MSRADKLERAWERIPHRLHQAVGLRYDEGTMGIGTQVEENEVTLLGRAFDARRGRFPDAAAREILEAKFPPADHARMEELGAKARAGTLLPDEKALLDRYVRAGHLLAMLKSKARTSMRQDVEDAK